MRTKNGVRMIVYLLRNKVNGKVYVGQTTKTLEHRWQTHVGNRGVQIKAKCLVDRAIRKYGADNFERAMLAKAANQEQLDYLESLFIVLYNSSDKTVGYNNTLGGSGGPGRIASKETREKLSAWQKGKKLSEEHKASLSVAQKRRFASGFPEEVKKKQSAALKGKPWSPARRAASQTAVETRRRNSVMRGSW